MHTNTEARSRTALKALDGANVHPWRRSTANYGCDCRLAGAHQHVCGRSLARRLVRGRGRVYLDLREYSQQRKGTRFELTELLRRAPIDKVVLLIDAKDDVAHFTAEVESIWQEVGGYRSDIAGVGDLRILRFSRVSNREMRGLFAAAVHAATSRNQ